MYNGIGLQTPRGSGTSGHVQSNKFLANPRPSSFSEAGGCGIPNPAPTGIDGTRKPNKDILEHDRKRQVELRLLVLGDELEEQGCTEAEIEERIEEERKATEIEAAAEEEEGRPCAQSKGTGLIPPVDNFGEQADPSAADVEEVEDIVTSKKKGGSRIKLGNFAPEEDVMIVKSRLETSCDPIINTLQKKENFWQRITKRYNENRGQYPERTLRSIQSRWERIKQESEKIAGFLAENASGKSDADKTSEAAATYAGVEGHNFQFMHCWELLKDEPKWQEMMQKGVWDAAADRFGDHIPQGSNTINLDDDNPAAAASRKRPMGTDAVKASRKKNCSSVSMSSSEYASSNHSHHPDGNPSSYQGPCFAYQGAPAMHPPPSAEGVFHPPQTGLIAPVDNFGEQADPSAADVEEVEDIIRSKKKDGRRTKLSNFAPEEDVRIVKSRLEISCEPIINTGHKKENFWQRVTKRYNENRGRYPERTRRSIESRWEKIKQESEKFAGFLAESICVNASGKSDADKTSEAAATYAGVEGHNFQFMHCWVLLKDEPKWRDMIQKGGQHAAADRSGDHIPQGLNTINLDDDDPAAAASRKRPVGKRPVGRDTTKASRKNCSSVSTSSSEYASKMQEISLQKMSIWQDENCNKGDRLDQLATIEEKRYDELREHNKSILQLEHEKIRIMRDKLDMQMREKEREREEREKKEDERILKIDLDSCTPELRAYYQALREEIMEKLAARRMRNQRS